MCYVLKIRKRLEVLPYFMLLSDCDGFVSLDGGAIFGPANLRGRVGLNLHPQLHVLLKLG